MKSIIAIFANKRKKLEQAKKIKNDLFDAIDKDDQKAFEKAIEDLTKLDIRPEEKLKIYTDAMKYIILSDNKGRLRDLIFKIQDLDVVNDKKHASVASVLSEAFEQHNKELLEEVQEIVCGAYLELVSNAMDEQDYDKCKLLVEQVGGLMLTPIQYEKLFNDLSSKALDNKNEKIRTMFNSEDAIKQEPVAPVYFKRVDVVHAEKEN